MTNSLPLQYIIFRPCAGYFGHPTYSSPSQGSICEHGMLQESQPQHGDVDENRKEEEANAW